MDFSRKLNTFLFLVTLFFLSFMISCKPKTYAKLPKTTYENILNESPSKYYVIVYSVTCEYCERLESDVVNYYNKTKNDDSLPKIFVLCIDAVENKKMKVETDEEYDNFLDTKNYEDIKVSSYPALIEVTDKKVTVLISTKTTTRPYSEIKNYLNY